MDSDDLSAERYTLEEAARNLTKLTWHKFTPRKLLELGCRGQFAIAVWSNASKCWCYVPKEELFQFEQKETYTTSTLGFHSTAQEFYDDKYDGPIVGSGSEIIGINDLRVFNSDLSRICSVAWIEPQGAIPSKPTSGFAEEAFHAINNTPFSKIFERQEREYRQRLESLNSLFASHNSPNPYTEKAPVSGVVEHLDQRADRMARGRYTLEEAAESIATATGEKRESILALLTNAVECGQIPRYPPGSNIPYPPERTLRIFWDEIYCVDVVQWIKDHHPRITFVWPSPSTGLAEQLKFDPISPKGGDALTPYVWSVCAQFTKEERSLRPVEVMKELKKLAKQGLPYFYFEEAPEGVKFEDGEGNVKVLTLDALRKRISEWKKRSSNTPET